MSMAFPCLATTHTNLPPHSFCQDAETGKALRTLHGHTNYVFCCSFHPYGHLLVRPHRLPQ